MGASGCRGTRLRLAELAGWPQPAESVNRVAEAARLREDEPTAEAMLACHRRATVT